ncbi:MAG TPA: M14 family metallopeptidase [Puia sp.]
MRIIIYIFLSLSALQGFAQHPQTPFETSGGQQTATYFECIAFYKKLDAQSSRLSIRTMGTSDAGYPYHLLLYSNDGSADPGLWRRQHKVILLINNGIHPGEPDGVDASMLLLRDLVSKKISLPDNIALAVIPLYNIGGALNRGSFSRVNQNGPASYGFRGNAQDLDLNRDFTKCDTRNARSFSQIFHWVDPDILIDNHVSDGADYQYTMTLLVSQWNKLGGTLGAFLHDTFQPALFAGMAKKGWPMTPYVNFEEGNPDKGWEAFYDPPRYSSGYATLFHTLAFMPETHMLKKFKDRVWSTYALMEVMIKEASLHAKALLQARNESIKADRTKTSWPLSWSVDSTRCDTIPFKGYEAGYKTSEVTGLSRMYYDHNRPFEKEVRLYDHFKPEDIIRSPRAYVIPQGWHEVIDLLTLNGVKMRRFTQDTMIPVEAYHIDSYKSYPEAYEKHHKNTNVKISARTVRLAFLKGDYWIPTAQQDSRFIIEMLEPTGADSYFAWNFFDAILEQKEYYSDYRWEDVAAVWLQQHPEIKDSLEKRRHDDPAFAKNADAQLEFVYRHSPYYEPEHLRYPVYRVMQ